LKASEILGHDLGFPDTHQLLTKPIRKDIACKKMRLKSDEEIMEKQ
jgi:hypothetical protein